MFLVFGQGLPPAAAAAPSCPRQPTDRPPWQDTARYPLPARSRPAPASTCTQTPSQQPPATLTRPQALSPSKFQVLPDWRGPDTEAKIIKKKSESMPHAKDKILEFLQHGRQGCPEDTSRDPNNRASESRIPDTSRSCGFREAPKVHSTCNCASNRH